MEGRIRPQDLAQAPQTVWHILLATSGARLTRDVPGSPGGPHQVVEPDTTLYRALPSPSPSTSTPGLGET